jgi:hypothetical protein
MSAIRKDSELKQALHQLDPVKRRDVCAGFVDSVMSLNTAKRVTHAIATAHDPDAGEDELLAAFKAARAATVESRTRCGADCNWDEQAAHFVARATAAAVAPEGHCKAPDPPWQVVMSCRMARNCALIEADDDSDNAENEVQYKIMNDLLG